MSTNMTSWAFNAATRFVEQERMRSEQWANAVQKHQRLVAQAPALWESVREALRAQVHTFNEHVGKHVMLASGTGEKKLAVHAQTESGPRAITVEFDAERCSISCSACSPDGRVDFEKRFQMSVNAEANASMAIRGGVACSAEEAAGHMLNGLMGWSTERSRQ